MQRPVSPYRSTSPYAPPPPDSYRQSYTPAPPPAVSPKPPGSITYTTLAGPDGRTVYQLFKAVEATYPTGNGRKIPGIQWVSDGIVTKLPPGAQPPDVNFATSWGPAGPGNHWGQGTGQDAKSHERRKSFNASSPPGAGIYAPAAAPNSQYSQSPYSGYADRPAGTPVPPYPSNAANAGYYASDLDRKMGDMNIRDRGRDYPTTHAPVPQKYTSNDLTGPTPRSVSPHPGGPAVAGPYNSATASGAYSRSPNMRAASPNPHPAEAKYIPPAPGGYPPYARSASPNPAPLPRAASPYGPPAGGYASRAASPYGPPAGPPLRSTTPYGGPAAGPQPRPTSPYGPPAGPPPSITPYGAPPGAPPAVYPRGHALEGQPLLPQDRSRVVSPMPQAANLPSAASGPYSSSAVAAPRGGTSPNIPSVTVPFTDNRAPPAHQLAAPEGFSRPVNGSHPFTPFDIMKIQDMEKFWSEIPRMPNVLNTHDVFEEDWRRLMQDMALAWAGRLPVEQDGPAAQRTAIVGDLIDLWNQSFLLIRGIELVLFRGKERRTGRYAGAIERDLPYLEEPDDYISSEDEISSANSDSDLDYGAGRFQHAYGDPHQTLANVFEEGRRRKEQKFAREAERKRRRQERHRRRREKYRARKYALYMTYVPTSVTAGNNYGGHSGYPAAGAGYGGGRY